MDHKYQRIVNGLDSTSRSHNSATNPGGYAALIHRHRQVLWQLGGLTLYTIAIVLLALSQSNRHDACPEFFATSGTCAIFVEEALAASFAAKAAVQEQVANTDRKSPEEENDKDASSSSILDFENYEEEVAGVLPGRNDVDRVHQQCRWNAKRFDTRPFASGDAFRLFSDFIFDDIEMCNEPPVNASFFPGCSIFVKGEYLPRFFEEVHPLIRVPYVLVTHNTDYGAPIDTRAQFGVKNLWENKTDLVAEVTSNTLSAWFGVNMVATDLAAYQLATEKFFNIPIGIQNVKWFDPTRYSERLDNATRTDRSDCLAFVAWRSWTSASRHLNRFEHMQNETHPDFDPSFIVWSEKKKPVEWMEQVMRCKYVVAPRGNGVDTHRHWESMILGAIPITQKGPLDPLYKEFPMLIVDSYDDITRELLDEKYGDLKKRLDDERQQAKLYTSYWFNKIRRKQYEARASYTTQKWEPKIFGTPIPTELETNGD